MFNLLSPESLSAYGSSAGPTSRQEMIHLLKCSADELLGFQQRVEDRVNCSEVFILSDPFNEIVIRSFLFDPVAGRLRHHPNFLVRLLPIASPFDPVKHDLLPSHE